MHHEHLMMNKSKILLSETLFDLFSLEWARIKIQNYHEHIEKCINKSIECIQNGKNRIKGF